MKKSLFYLLLVLVSYSGFSQQDSIVNFFDKKGKLVTSKKDAKTFEVLTKMNDTLWVSKKYRRNGKLSRYSHYTSKDKKTLIGQSMTYDKHGNTISLMFYNKNGKRHGKMSRWFANGNKDTEGIYLEGKREGVWKLYHLNGKIAFKGIFKAGALLKSSFYNEDGNKIDFEYTNFKVNKAKFKGGREQYNQEVRNIVRKLKYIVSGSAIVVDYVIDTNGDITDITIDEKIPMKLRKQIITKFQDLKGWSPATQLNRVLPSNYSQALYFRRY